MKSIAWLSIFFAFPQILPAQLQTDFSFRNYSIKEGLPNNYALSFAQDKFGFIWIGTSNGLSRFDGLHFTNYFKTTDSTSLYDNLVRTLAADKYGHVWTAFKNKIGYYDYATDNFHYLELKGVNDIGAIALDSSGDLWFRYADGVGAVDTRTLSTHLYHLPISKKLAFSLWVDRFNHIIVDDDSALLSYDINLKPYAKIPKDFDPSGVSSVYTESDDRTWYTFHNNKLYCFDKRQNATSTFLLSEKETSFTSYSNLLVNPALGDSILWFASSDLGLAMFNLHSKKFETIFKSEKFDEHSLASSQCNNILADRDGNLWIATFSGVSCLNISNQSVHNIRLNETGAVRRILPDKSNSSILWLVTYGTGIFRYDMFQKKLITQYPLLQTLPSGQKYLGTGFDALYDRSGKLWLGADKGLYYYDEGKNNFNYVPYSNGKTKVSVLRIIEGKPGVLWLGSDSGLWKYNITTNNFRYIAGINNDRQGKGYHSVYYLKFDNYGHLLVGTEKGLNILDTATGAVTWLYRQQNLADTFQKNYIWGIDVDKHGKIWVASRGGYAWSYDQLHRTFADYDLKNGLNSNVIREIFVDTLGIIWMQTSYDGVYKYDPVNNKTAQYGIEQGLGALYPGQGRWSIINNKIYAGFENAFSVIDPYQERESDFPVYIQAITLLNRNIPLIPGNTGSQTIRLKYKENAISFQYVVIDYDRPDKLHFFYRLVGLNDTWQDAGSQRSVTFTNLHGGDYSFEVKAVNTDGKESLNTAQLKFYIQPPFWQTWWFWVLLALIFSALIILIFYTRVNAVRRKEYERSRVREQIAEAEMKALRAQMNPHFVFNCMNIIDGLISSNRKKEAQEVLQKFARLMRLVLENSQHALVPVNRDIEALQLYIELEAMRSNYRFVYHFNIDDELVQGDYKIPPLLIQPYVENAIVHGLRHKENGKGDLVVDMKLTNENIFIVVDDNGIGRVRSAEINSQTNGNHQHLGMRVTQQRIETLNLINHTQIKILISDLESGSGNAEPGTHVEIVVPAEIKSQSHEA